MEAMLNTAFRFRLIWKDVLGGSKHTCRGIGHAVMWECGVIQREAPR